MQTCVLAFSGGLDTSYCVLHLRERGYDVVTVSVDTGGFSAAENSRIAALSKQLGASNHLAIDARETLWRDYLRYLLFGNVLRGNVYPLSVSAERACQAKMVAQQAAKIGAAAIAHGSTGAGNDQIRFDVAFRALAPACTLLAPIRELALSRDEEIAVLTKAGVSIPPKASKYSINAGMWGTSIGGSETHDSWQHLPDESWPSGPVDLAQNAQRIVLRFAAGVAVAIDGESMAPVALIERLNRLGARFGIGRGMHLGDTILGIKGRVAFEAPAAHLLIAAHRELEKLVLSGKQMWWKDQLGSLYGNLVHEGHYFDPLRQDLEAFLDSSQRQVEGEVRILLRPHQFTVEGVRSPHSLMQSKVASYGEGAKAWNGVEAAGFCKLFGIAQQLSLSMVKGES
jgi:argininosuccinate synthase